MAKSPKTKKTLTAKDIFDKVKDEESKKLESVDRLSTKRAMDNFHKKMRKVKGQTMK